MKNFLKENFRAALISLLIFSVVFFLIWFFDPPFVQDKSALDKITNSDDKNSATTLQTKYNIKICNKCSMNGLKFISFTILISSSVIILIILIFLSIYLVKKKNSAKNNKNKKIELV